MERLNQRLFSWARICDDATREQVMKTSTMPFIWPHMALMSECHLGKGATVGSLIPTLGAIIPAAVGVGIGCGIMAVRTQLTADDMRSRGNLAALRESIEKAIPLSARHYSTELGRGARSSGRTDDEAEDDGRRRAGHLGKGDSSQTALPCPNSLWNSGQPKSSWRTAEDLGDTASSGKNSAHICSAVAVSIHPS
jgi:hypothetical protein